MRVNSKGHIGVIFMQYLATRPYKLISLQEVSEANNLSLHYLEQITSKMGKKKGDILISKKGPHGGNSLGRPANQISLKEIYEAVGEKVDFTCSIPSVEEGPVPPEIQILNRFMESFANEFKEKLHEIKLSDICKFKGE